MGDVITGSKSHVKSLNWLDSLSTFLKNTKLSKTMMSKSIFLDGQYFPQNPITNDSRFNFYEQHYLSYRQKYYIESIILNKDYDIVTPFYDKRVVNYFFNIPVEYRINQKLFKEILKNSLSVLIIRPLRIYTLEN